MSERRRRGKKEKGVVKKRKGRGKRGNIIEEKGEEGKN